MPARKRRKYEPCGGVVSLHWESGYPYGARKLIDDGCGPIFAEVWTANMGYAGKTVAVHAEFVQVTLSKDGVLLFGGHSIGERVCRRWCRAPGVFTHVPVTLQDWPDAD